MILYQNKILVNFQVYTLIGGIKMRIYVERTMSHDRFLSHEVSDPSFYFQPRLKSRDRVMFKTPPIYNVYVSGNVLNYFFGGFQTRKCSFFTWPFTKHVQIVGDTRGSTRVRSRVREGVTRIMEYLMPCICCSKGGDRWRETNRFGRNCQVFACG